MWQRATMMCKHGMCVEWWGDCDLQQRTCHILIVFSTWWSNVAVSSSAVVWWRIIFTWSHEGSGQKHTLSLVFKYGESFASSTSSLSPSSGWKLHYTWSRSNSNRRSYQRLKHLSIWVVCQIFKSFLTLHLVEYLRCTGSCDLKQWSLNWNGLIHEFVNDRKS